MVVPEAVPQVCRRGLTLFYLNGGVATPDPYGRAAEGGFTVKSLIVNEVHDAAFQSEHGDA